MTFPWDGFHDHFEQVWREALGRLEADFNEAVSLTPPGRWHRLHSVYDVAGRPAVACTVPGTALARHFAGTGPSSSAVIDAADPARRDELARMAPWVPYYDALVDVVERLEP